MQRAFTAEYAENAEEFWSFLRSLRLGG